MNPPKTHIPDAGGGVKTDWYEITQITGPYVKSLMKL